jgi:hypothetical protein
MLDAGYMQGVCRVYAGYMQGGADVETRLTNLANWVNFEGVEHQMSKEHFKVFLANYS